jgi:hypothetical protein
MDSGSSFHTANERDYQGDALQSKYWRRKAEAGMTLPRSDETSAALSGLGIFFDD